MSEWASWRYSLLPTVYSLLLRALRRNDRSRRGWRIIADDGIAVLAVVLLQHFASHSCAFTCPDTNCLGGGRTGFADARLAFADARNVADCTLRCRESFDCSDRLMVSPLAAWPDGQEQQDQRKPEGYSDQEEHICAAERRSLLALPINITGAEYRVSNQSEETANGSPLVSGPV